MRAVAALRVESVGVAHLRPLQALQQQLHLQVEEAGLPVTLDVRRVKLYTAHQYVWKIINTYIKRRKNQN